VPASDALEAIKGKLGLLNFPRLAESSALQIFMGVMAELFTNSLPTHKVGAKPLGDLATNLVMLLTSIEPYQELLMENPLLHAYGSVEQMYLDMLRESTLAVAKRDPKWPLRLRALTIPLSDEVFTDRFDHSVALGISKVAKLLIVYMTELGQSGITSPARFRYRQLNLK